MKRENGKNLRELRKLLGLSQKDLAEKVGVDRRTIGVWEAGQSHPQKRYESKLHEIFDDCPKVPEAPPRKVTAKKPRYNKKDKKSKRVAESLSTIQRKFIVGNCYMITDRKMTAQEMTFQQLILRYERKEGIHHVFRAVRGKWITTYTDAQLVGKNIKEVEDF